jgi:hypothetical protein
MTTAPQRANRAIEKLIDRAMSAGQRAMDGEQDQDRDPEPDEGPECRAGRANADPVGLALPELRLASLLFRA